MMRIMLGILCAVFCLSAFAVGTDPDALVKPGDPEFLVRPGTTPLSGPNPSEYMNPDPALGKNLAPNGPPGSGAPPLSPEAQQTMQRVQGFVSGIAADPRMEALKKKGMLLVGDEKFLKAAEEMWTSPKRQKMFEFQLVFFIFMILAKAWQQSRSKNWFQKFLMGIICTVITCVGVSYVIPLLVLGEPFGVFTGTIWRVFVVGG